MAAERDPNQHPVTRIVLIGGGYTSVGAWKVLSRSLEKELCRGQVEVTVVSSHNAHYFHGFVGEMISGVVGVASGMSAARRIFAGARFITGRVTRVDAGRHLVHVSLGDTAGGAAEAPDELLLSYDHLVVGLGARYKQGAVPGLDDYGWAMRDVGALQGFRNHVIGCFERADVLPSDEQVRRALTFVVAGGGFAGVEMTAALCELAIEMRRHYGVLCRVRPRIVLVHSGPRILPDVAAQPRVVAYAERHLARYGVELRLGTRVARVEPSEVTLSTGDVIAADTVLSTIGNEVTPLPGLHAFADEQRRLRTNAYLQVSGTDGCAIWAGGDCARVVHARSGRPCPANALWAIKQGEHIGRNLARVVRGRAPKPFTFRGLGVAASMGIGKGMGELFGVALTGRVAWVVRLVVFLYFMPSRQQALSALLEHCKLPFCGRSVVPLDVVVPRGLGPAQPAVTEWRERYLGVLATSRL